MNHFATLFDINYLSRGLCLIDSLNQTLKDQYSIFILALDEATSSYFERHPSPAITVLTLSQLEANYPALIQAKENRSQVEYYFTLSPILPLYILTNYPECNRITTLDSDLYFFSSPKIIFDKYPSDAILITPHDFSAHLNKHLEFGIYNVSFQSFPNTPQSLKLLNRWKDQCIFWCYDYLDPKTGYYGDQKYLDDWPQEFDEVKVIKEKSMSRAPWNIDSSNIHIKNGKFYVDDALLIYFHFHKMRFVNNYVSLGLIDYGVYKISQTAKKMYTDCILRCYDYNQILKMDNDQYLVRNKINGTNKGLIDFISTYQFGAIIIWKRFVVYYSIFNAKPKKILRFIKKIFNG